MSVKPRCALERCPAFGVSFDRLRSINKEPRSAPPSAERAKRAVIMDIGERRKKVNKKMSQDCGLSY